MGLIGSFNRNYLRMKKLGKLNLDKLKRHGTLIGSTEANKLIGGISVTFDRSDGMIYVYDDWGALLGSYEAGNNVTTNSQGIWSNGTYSMYDQLQTHTHSEGDTYEGPYGTHGIYRADPFYDEECEYRTGMGLHAGRSGNVNYVTYGCIRTTEEAMADIDCFIDTYGAFTSITVQD